MSDHRFLLASRYDGSLNKGVLRFINAFGQFEEEVDKTNHSSYCLISTQYESFLRDQMKEHTYIKDLQQIKKKHLIKDLDIPYLKVLVETPSDVPKLRTLINKDKFVWEDHIKYYRSYLYDLNMVPGYWYTHENITIPFSQPSDMANVEYIGEAPRVSRFFLPAFFSDIPQLPFCGLDIEIDGKERQVPDANRALYPVSCVCFYFLREGVVEKRAFVLRPQEEGLSIPTEFFDSEKSLLLRVFEFMDQIPLIFTFNGDSFDFSYLYHRAGILGVPCPISYNPKNEETSLPHGIHIDLYPWFANPSLKTYAYGKKYDRDRLEDISQALLGEGKVELEMEIKDLPTTELITYCMKDAELVVRLFTNDNWFTWNTMILLSRIACMGLDDLVRHGISRMSTGMYDYLHRQLGYIIPNSYDLKKKGREATVQGLSIDSGFKGGLVSDPVPGVHFLVKNLDFASLYPSVNKVYNLSYETMNCPHEECKKNVLPGEVNHWVCTRYRGLQAETIGFIRDIRVFHFKVVARGSAREQTLKVWCNASYGAGGSDSYSYYCVPVSEAITGVGRYVMGATREKAQEQGIEVVYGHTDSTFLKKVTSEQIEFLIQWCKEQFNLDLELDEEFIWVVLSERKANYLGLTENGKMVVKGLAGEKRHIPIFIKQVFEAVKGELQSVRTPEEMEEAKEEIKEVILAAYDCLLKAQYNVEDLSFKMRLSRELNSYETNSIHVKAARILQQKTGITLGTGDDVRYVKTRTPGGVLPIEVVRGGEIDLNVYRDLIKSTLEPITGILGIEIEKKGTQRGLEVFW